jgi:hypothetical protein
MNSYYSQSEIFIVSELMVNINPNGSSGSAMIVTLCTFPIEQAYSIKIVR